MKSYTRTGRSPIIALIFITSVLGQTACGDDAPSGVEPDGAPTFDAGDVFDDYADADADADIAGDGDLDADGWWRDAEADAADGRADAEIDAPLPDCEPALAVSPETGFRNAFGLLQLEPSGGTGAYRFELFENNSDALVNEITGSYLAGDVVGAVDRVRLTDVGCAGSAEASVEIVDPIVVRPLFVELEKRSGFTFEVEGGSGQLSFELIRDPSGGRITPAGAYTAGRDEGSDVIQITDVGTTQSVEAVVRVKADAPMDLRAERIIIPRGSRFAVDARGGSGWFDLSGGDGVVAWTDETIEGLIPGRTVVTVHDRFGGQEAELEVTVSDPLFSDLPRSGDRFDAARALAPGDLDGDGRADAILALPEADVEFANAGAVMIYSGRRAGLSPQPTQILTGSARHDWFGWDAALADVTGDGRLDLVVGSPPADATGSNSGRCLRRY